MGSICYAALGFMYDPYALGYTVMHDCDYSTGAVQAHELLSTTHNTIKTRSILNLVKVLCCLLIGVTSAVAGGIYCNKPGTYWRMNDAGSQALLLSCAMAGVTSVVLSLYMVFVLQYVCHVTS